MIRAFSVCRIVVMAMCLIVGCANDNNPQSKLIDEETLTSLASDGTNQDIVPAETVATNIPELPFPDRVSPFQSPRDVTASSKRTAESNKGGLRLCGFVDVGGTAAVVMHNGRTEILKPGDRLLQIKLVAVRPPFADFESGGRMWATSLLNNNGLISISGGPK